MKNVNALAAAVSDLAALLDYAGKHREATALRDDLHALPTRGLRFKVHLRGGISTLQQAVPSEAREAAGGVVARIRRVLSEN